MGDLMDCHEKDKLKQLNPPIPKTSKKKKSKNKKRKKSNDGENELLRKHLRASCERHLANVKPPMNGSVHNSPIVIEGGGENEVSYETIREYIMGRKKSVAINEETVTAFFKKVKKNDNSVDFNREE